MAEEITHPPLVVDFQIVETRTGGFIMRIRDADGFTDTDRVATEEELHAALDAWLGGLLGVRAKKAAR